MFVGLLLTGLVLAACNTDGGDNAPTRLPTRVPPTPTPRSTALPEVATAQPLGQGARRIELHVAAPGGASDRATQDLATDLTRYLDEALELEIPVTFVTETDAFDALCSGAPRAAWLSAVTFAAAYEECGVVPVLAVIRGRRPLQTLGTTAEIVAPREVTALTQLEDGTFCRSDQHDLLTTWILPGMFMAAQGVDPLLDLADVRDFPDDRALLEALIDGECSAGAFPPGAFESLREELELDPEIDVHVILPSGDTSPPRVAADWPGYDAQVLPYEVLAFSPDSALPERQRDALAKAIHGFFTDRTHGEARLRTLLDASGVIEVEADDFSVFLATMSATRWQLVRSD